MPRTPVTAAFLRAGYVPEDTGGGFEVMARYRPGLVIAVNDGESEVPTTWNAEATVCLYEPEIEAWGVNWGTDQVLCFEIQIRQLLATHDNSAAVLDAMEAGDERLADQGSSRPLMVADRRLVARLPLSHAVLIGGLLDAGIPVRVIHFASGPGVLLLIYGRKVPALGLAEYLSEQAQQIGGAFWMMFVPGVSAA